ncbi:hypothetical protein PoB_004629100, partial [Plakobranchus ocellatus]
NGNILLSVLYTISFNSLKDHVVGVHPFNFSGLKGQQCGESVTFGQTVSMYCAGV